LEHEFFFWGPFGQLRAVGNYFLATFKHDFFILSSAKKNIIVSALNNKLQNISFMKKMAQNWPTLKL
jgi:5-methylthioribose kinase